MPNVDSVCEEIGTSGEMRTLELTGDAGVDIAAAVTAEHPCNDNACDIREANENDFPFTAAWLLVSATECPLLGAVLDAYELDARELPRDFEEWKQHFDRYGRECASCGAFTFAGDYFEPENCGNCLAELPSVDREAFTDAYIECALWSSNDDRIDPQGRGAPLDATYDVTDIEPATTAKLESDCDDFIDANERDLVKYQIVTGRNSADAGHDFWLTRNGHGAGFWDRGNEEVLTRLTNAAKAHGEFHLDSTNEGTVIGYDG